mmetsp:Transcript_34061/g.83753  ORF Transcript_34061/g.83753 Transcript_34061/m.83753 type:complete len:254 (+) Transcript_34061:402-1163(+)
MPVLGRRVYTRNRRHTKPPRRHPHRRHPHERRLPLPQPARRATARRTRLPPGRRPLPHDPRVPHARPHAAPTRARLPQQQHPQRQQLPHPVLLGLRRSRRSPHALKRLTHIIRHAHSYRVTDSLGAEVPHADVVPQREQRSLGVVGQRRQGRVRREGAPLPPRRRGGVSLGGAHRAGDTPPQDAGQARAGAARIGHVQARAAHAAEARRALPRLVPPAAHRDAHGGARLAAHPPQLDAARQGGCTGACSYGGL